MGKAKKNSPKTTPARGGRRTAKNTISNAPAHGIRSLARAEGMNLREAEPENNFDYAFDLTNATVLDFSVEDHKQPVPPETGSFQVDIDDPNPQKKARVIVLVREDLPGGSAILTLKYQGKPVSTPALVFSGGKAGFDELLNLP